MNTKRFYVVDQDNRYYECKTEKILFENVLRKFSFDQIGLSLNEIRVKHVAYHWNEYFQKYFYEREFYKVDLVVYDHLWRVVTHDKLREIYDNVMADLAEKRQKRFFAKYASRFRYDPVPYTGKGKWRWGRYYRSPKTTNERRQSYACDPEYVRSKRNYIHLPNAWDDVSCSRYKMRSWKDCTKKRKQWM